MVFKRRDPKTWAQAIGHFFYPKGGWGRAGYYVMHRLRRLPDPPHRIARGVAAGVFASFTPFFGFHFVEAALLAYLMQGNILAALLATFFGNPITFPIIAAVALELGNWMLGYTAPVHLPQVFSEFSAASVQLWQNLSSIFTGEEAEWHQLRRFYHRVFRPYMVGGIIPGIITGIACYMLTLPAVTAYQNRRVKKLRERYEKRLHAVEKPDPPSED